MRLKLGANSGDILDDLGDLFERELSLDGPFKKCSLVHTIDDGSTFILAERKSLAARIALQPSTPSRPMPVIKMPTVAD